MMHNALTLLEKIQSLPDERIAEVEDFVDFLKHKAQKKKHGVRDSLDFPVISVGRWPDNLGLRREDIYDDDGR